MTDAELKGLIGEVEEMDMYHVRKMDDIVSINDPKHVHVHGHARGFDFEPNVIFDLGANIGVFTRYARKLFPQAFILAVEPNPDSAKQISGHNIKVIEKAIGIGKAHRAIGAGNSTGESFLSAGLGFREDQLKDSRFFTTEFPTVKLSELIEEFVFTGDKLLIKLDIEGGENAIFGDQKEMEALRRADFLAAELHWFAGDAAQVEEVTTITEQALKSFEATHICKKDGVYFYATRK